MNRLLATKLLTVAMAAIRRFCDQENINFLAVVAKSNKNTMTLTEIEEYIDNFDEGDLQ